MVKNFRAPAFLLSLIMIFSLASCVKGQEKPPTKVSESTAAVNEQEPAESETHSETQSETEYETDEPTSIEESETTLDESSVTQTEASSDTAEETTAQSENTESQKQESTDVKTAEIIESDGTATVKTVHGLSYQATGYAGITEDGNAFLVEDVLSIDLLDSFTSVFNRFSLKITTTASVKLYLNYTCGRDAREDCFFIEAGETDFSAYIPYLFDTSSSKRSHHIEGFRIVPCSDSQAEFYLEDFTSERADIPERDLLLEGDNLILGVDLMWGGAITYVSDKNCHVDGLDNLINCHDPGRLVQQSYYGTGAIPGVFDWGSFNGQNWPYNPVQGGGQGGIYSRLIDYKVEGNCIYVKSQPMDWGKVGYVTPSYMENWYYIEDNYIRVDNRFIDFSGWEHPANGQEIPAFYTVSYLESFVFYDGVEPWSGGALTYKNTLPDWGDNKNASQCNFRIKEPNTEVWCAWINQSDNYGIGIYTPGADRFSAGRYAYNNSKDPASNSTNYVAPWKHIKIVSYEPLEYSYLLTTGSIEDIRSTFEENKDLITNSYITENGTNSRQPYFDQSLESIDLTKEDALKYLLYPSTTAISFDNSENVAKLTVTGGDPHVTFDYLASKYPLNTSDYAYLEIEYMIPTGNSRSSYTAQLFLCSDDCTSATESDSTRVNLIKDGEYHTFKIKLRNLDFWEGQINLIRFDYFDGSGIGDVIYLRSVSFTNNHDAEINMKEVDLSRESSLPLVTGRYRTEVIFDTDQEATKLTVLGDDPSITLDYSLSDVSLNADDFTYLKITYMVPADQSRADCAYALYPCVGSVTSPTADAHVFSPNGIIADGEYHTLIIDMSGYTFWSGRINKIRFDYFNEYFEIGEVFYIKSIVLE